MLRQLSSHDEGFSLVEAVMALTVLTVGVILSVTPVMSSFEIIREAEVNTVAANLATRELEEIKALAYDDVGLPGGSPTGSLEASRTIVVDNRSFTVELEVEYVGSVTGLDVIPGGGDGVQGSFDPGINFKHVRVSVTPVSGATPPVVMSSILAPPRVGAFDEIANVVVELVPFEPVGTPTTESSHPFPRICLDSFSYRYISTDWGSTQIFAGIEPSDPDPMDPNYAYDVLAGGGCATSSSGWHLLPSTLANPVHAPIGDTTNAAAGVYRPATLVVEVRDATTLLPIASGPRLTVDDGVESWDFDDSSPEWNSTRGTWTIRDLGGYPLVPNIYDLTVSAPTYSTEVKSAVEVPAGYPTTMTEVVAFDLMAGTTDPVTFYVHDERQEPIAGASVIVSGGPISGSIVGVTDGSGQVLLDLPVSSVTQRTNVGIGSLAAQNTTGWNGFPAHALDDSTSGQFWDFSTTHTRGGSQPYWEVDLGTSSFIDEIVIWNRTDCCTSRLRDFYVFVSDAPFTSTTVSGMLADPNVTAFYQAGIWPASGTVTVDSDAQYVRIQQSRRRHLSLAEVEIFASAVSYDVEVISPGGHRVFGPTPVAHLHNDPVRIPLGESSGQAFIAVRNAGDAVDFGYRPRGSTADFAIVPINDNAWASAVVAPTRYELAALCPDGSTAASGQVNVNNARRQRVWNAGNPICP